uniref:class I SAM-dependent methyltransferase n=1 Tax=Bacteroidota TaxID=976 RepID=UPI00404752C0
MGEIDLLRFYPKSNRKFFYKKRRKLSGSGYISLDRGHFTDEDLMVEYSMIAKAREFGYLYFDGDRVYGYGGYAYDKKYWEKTARYLLEFYEIKDGMNVLDIGCAKGFLLYEMKKINPTLKIYGVDVSDYAIENAKEEVKENLVKASADNLPFGDNFFDLVISINTIDHLDFEGCRKALFEIERVKKEKSFITVNSWFTELQKDNILAWNLVSKMIMGVEEWKLFFKQNNYTGDFYWFIAE